MPDCFADRFCAQLGLAPAQFTEFVLQRTLYPHARLLRPLIAWVAPEFFAVDRAFVFDVGRLRRRADFGNEVADFINHPANRTALRRVLRLRVSVGRMRALLDTGFAPAP